MVEKAVVRFLRTTAADSKQYEVAHYNLDMVLALGFRVRSPVGVRFRQWANDKACSGLSFPRRRESRSINALDLRLRGDDE